MKRIVGLSLFLLGFSFFLFARDDLLPRHRQWLEDVSPILTPAEREIFSRLKSEADRDKFIKFFWRQRDPLPDTAENEFYKEYMERVRTADQMFGRGTSKRGSQTERGYFYLLLGPPLERQQFATHSQIWPLELWFYKGEVEFGLPPYFYLIFYQPQGSGEFRLYSPGIDGPEKLVIPAMSSRGLSRSSAYQILRQVNAELANASLNYLPGEQTLSSSGLASNMVLASVRSLPEKKFSDTYARNYLSYKDYVETEYSDRFIDSSFAAKIFRHSGQAFIHWTLEPRRINFAERGGRYQASFDLVLRLEDMDGTLILEDTEEIPLSLAPEQYQAHARQAFAFQDVLPVIPGRFRLFGLLKNKTAQDFTSFSALITVPGPATGIQLGELLIYHHRENAGGETGRGLRAFTFGGLHYLVNARNEFPPGAEMGIFVQVSGLSDMRLSPQTTVLVEIRSVEADGGGMSVRKSLAETFVGEGEGLDTGLFSLADLKPGYYSAELFLVDENSRPVASAKGNFVLLPRPLPLIPWVYARVHPPFPNAGHLYLLGSEHFQSGQHDQALARAGEALRLKDDPAARILLARILFALGRFEDALDAARPVYEATRSREAGKIVAASRAALKDWPAALAVLEELLAGATEVGLLNLAGECHLQLHQPEKALPYFEKSLGLVPDQPVVRELEKKAKSLIK